MIIHRMQQGSPEWVDARLGIPTCSNADRIVTPAQLKPAAAMKRYAVELAIERLWGTEVDNVDTLAMQRGVALEDQAVAYYAFTRDVDVDRVGFIENDARTFGGSPDGLVGPNGIVEVKTPLVVNHAMHFVYEDFAKEHRGQCQSMMWLTGRKWCDLISFNPSMDPYVVRVDADAEYAEAFAKTFAIFLELLAVACRKIGVPSDWRERIEQRAAERAAIEAEAAKHYPAQERTPVDMEDTRRAFIAGARVR